MKFAVKRLDLEQLYKMREFGYKVSTTKINFEGIKIIEEEIEKRQQK
jgi:hypothetical protein